MFIGQYFLFGMSTVSFGLRQERLKLLHCQFISTTGFLLSFNNFKSTLMEFDILSIDFNFLIQADQFVVSRSYTRNQLGLDQSLQLIFRHQLQECCFSTVPQLAP
ncbi:Uncharacterised protein [Mycobacterium tuberculosis]|nr:Uncharacterised protein [Mycobacterium tuberculosis]